MSNHDEKAELRFGAVIHSTHMIGASVWMWEHFEEIYDLEHKLGIGHSTELIKSIMDKGLAAMQSEATINQRTIEEYNTPTSFEIMERDYGRKEFEKSEKDAMWERD